MENYMHKKPSDTLWVIEGRIQQASMEWRGVQNLDLKGQND